MKFVKVTRVDQGPKYETTEFVNLEHVTRLTLAANQTKIYTVDSQIIFVKETPEEILIRLPSIGG